jgi:hypothetical protein
MRLSRERFTRPNLERWSRSRKWEDFITATSAEQLEKIFQTLALLIS